MPGDTSTLCRNVYRDYALELREHALMHYYVYHKLQPNATDRAENKVVACPPPPRDISRRT